MTLAPAARRQYADWLGRFEGQPAEEPSEPWVSRLGTAALKVAMIYEVATSGGRTIGEEAVARAAALVEDLRARLAAALGEEGTGAPGGADFKRVCRVIQAAGPAGIAHNALLKRLSPMRSGTLRAILATLKEAGQVRERQEGKGAWYRWV
jgi:DNA-binding transcriptional ArsR family regulator